MPITRLLPNLDPGKRKPEWKFQVGSPEESQYDKVVSTVSLAESLLKIVRDQKLTKAPPFTKGEADEICQKTASHDQGVINDFMRAGVQCRQDLYRDAAAAGYDISKPEVRKPLDLLVSQYHSAMYSPFTESGRLLK